MKNEATKTQATEIIRSLIKRIAVSPTGRRGNSDVVLHGALASIFTYAAATDLSCAVTSNVGRVFLVVGAGFNQTHAIRIEV